MVDGLEFELVESPGNGNDSIKKITPGRLRHGFIMPKFEPLKPKTEIQIQRNAPLFF
jgi:hypothetical protein